MATTTNYGWTTPDDTALVKDGASAIRTLGSSIDTSLNNALGTKKAGLVLLNTTSFSAVATQSFNDVFSATYDNYVVKFKLLQSVAADNAFFFRMRASGSDDSTSNYHYVYLSAASGVVNSANTGSQTAGYLTNILGFSTYGTFELYSPFAAVPTMTRTIGAVPVGSTTARIFDTQSIHNVSTSFTGFTIGKFSGADTCTGTISIYGVNK